MTDGLGGVAATATRENEYKEREKDGDAGSERGFGWAEGVGVLRGWCPDSRKTSKARVSLFLRERERERRTEARVLVRGCPGVFLEPSEITS